MILQGRHSEQLVVEHLRMQGESERERERDIGRYRASPPPSWICSYEGKLSFDYLYPWLTSSMQARLRALVPDDFIICHAQLSF